MNNLYSFLSLQNMFHINRISLGRRISSFKDCYSNDKIKFQNQMKLSALSVMNFYF